MRAAVSALVGEEAARGLSANVVSRLKRSWDEEYRSWCRHSLADDWVYVWADGIHSGLRGAGERLCVLVVIGVNARGDKHFLAIEDGVRESTQSWREVLLSMKQRGLTRPAKLAVGDGVLGFWSALSEVYPETRSQRCWMHKTGNVLNYLPNVQAHRWRDVVAEGEAGPARDLEGRDPRRRPSAPSTTGSSATTTSTRRRPPAWSGIGRSCWPSTTSPASTGRRPNSRRGPGPRYADSSLMRKSQHHEYRQAYNAQAAVDADGSQLVLSSRVSVCASDRNELVADVDAIPAALGAVDRVLADSGYATGSEVSQLEGRGMEVLVATGAEGQRRRHDFRPEPPARLAKEPRADWIKAMREKMELPENRAHYRLRKQTVEPVFGIVKQAMGFRQFLLRGVEKVEGEWALVTLAYNCRRLHNLMLA